MNTKKAIVGAVFLLSIVVLFAACGMENLPKGQMIGEFSSPNGMYQINAYLCSGNATVDFSVRCEVVEIQSGNTRNIYWQYRCQNVSVEWIDDRTVEINGVVLDIITDSYDWRNS